MSSLSKTHSTSLSSFFKNGYPRPLSLFIFVLFKTTFGRKNSSLQRMIRTQFAGAEGRHADHCADQHQGPPLSLSTFISISFSFYSLSTYFPFFFLIFYISSISLFFNSQTPFNSLLRINFILFPVLFNLKLCLSLSLSVSLSVSLSLCLSLSLSLSLSFSDSKFQFLHVIFSPCVSYTPIYSISQTSDLIFFAHKINFSHPAEASPTATRQHIRTSTHSLMLYICHLSMCVYTIPCFLDIKYQ